MKLTEILRGDHHPERYATAHDPRFGMIHHGRVPDSWVRTTCGYCSVGCGMLVGVRGGQAVAVQGDPDHPVNRGRLCPKGLSEHQTLGPEALARRLQHPEIGDRAVSWDTALDHLLDSIAALVAKHGPESVAVISTGQLVTEEFYALGKLVRLGLGLTHYDGNTTLCMASAVSGYKMAFGSDGPPGCYDDFTEADCILLIGANVADNHPLLAPRLLANRDGTIITIDPRATKTSSIADLHLPVKPRTDITLLNAMIKVIIDEGLVDEEFVREHTTGFDVLAAHVAQYDLARAERECQISAFDIWRAAVTFGRAERATAAWTMGINHSVQGTESVALIATLCAITGNLGKSGASPFSITGQCNAMGTREAGCTASMPGYRPYDNPAARAELATLWGVDESRLPTARGWAYPDIIEGIIKGTVKGLWVIGTNPIVSFPNRETLEFALSRLDLLVVQDGFRTETAELAHVRLPAAIWGEKDGTYTNSERRVSRVRRAVEPPGEARSDFDIFLDVGARLGMRDELFDGWKTPEDAFEEWRLVSAGRPCDYSGMTYAAIDAAGGIQWPCQDVTQTPTGTPRLYSDGRVNTPDGRVVLHGSAVAVPLRDKPRPNFPFVLNTGRTVEHWHTRSKTGCVPILERLAPAAWVELHPADAGRLKVRSGDSVSLHSDRGVVESVSVRVTATVREGEVFVPFHYAEACINRLTSSEFDPISREPNYKQCAVRVEPERG